MYSLKCVINVLPVGVSVSKNFISGFSSDQIVYRYIQGFTFNIP